MSIEADLSRVELQLTQELSKCGLSMSRLATETTFHALSPIDAQCWNFQLGFQWESMVQCRLQRRRLLIDRVYI